MSITPHTVIKASAGTGKTYRLSIRILRLLAIGEPAEGITALTFTRAAAAEFLTKVVERLGEACASDKRHREICKDAALNPDEYTRESFARLLGEVMVDSNRLTLGTLDSFFARLVNTFPLEVGIETGTAEIVEAYDTQSVITEVACALLASKNEKELAGFAENLRQLAGGKSKATPTASLIQAADNLHEMYVNQSRAEAWGTPNGIWGPEDRQPGWFKTQDLEALKRDIAEVADRAAEQMEKDAPPAPLRDAKLAAEQRKWQAAMAKLIEYFKEDLEDFARGTHLAGVEYGKAKAGVKKHVFANADDARLIARVFQSLAGILVRERLSQTQAAHKCLREYEQAYDSLARRKGRLTYADYVRLLNENLFGDGPDHRNLPEIHYRMDSQVRHLLLDEFQDTSTMQFEALDPYILEVLSKADDPQSLFVVGDPKQSLYEWRAGNRRLLDTVVRRLEALGRPDRVEIQPLNETRRCAAPVLSLANRLLNKLERDEVGEDFPTATLDDWNAVYSPQLPYVDPENPSPPKVGESLWVRLGRQGGQSRKLPSIKCQARWIAWHLRQQAGLIEPKSGRLLNGLTCAILLRGNSDARAFAEELRSLGEDMKIDANDESEVNPATDNPVTAALLSVAKVALHPRDTMARGLAEMCPASRAYVAAHGGWDTTVAHVSDLFHKSGAEALIHDLCLSVTPEMLTEDNGFMRGRLGQLRSLAESYDQSGDRALSGFIRHCEGTELRGLADRGAVQVITTHRSKGLEYDMVYMPMPDDGHPMASVNDNDLLAFYPPRVEKTGMKDLEVFKPLWLTMGFSDSIGRVLGAIDQEHLGAARQRAMGEQAYGALCNLYVGITRARHRIVLLSDGLGGEGAERARRYQVNHLIHKRLDGEGAKAKIGPQGAEAEVMFADDKNSADWVELRLAEIREKQEKAAKEAAASDREMGAAIPGDSACRRPLRRNPSKGDHTYAQPSATEDLSKPIGGKPLGNRVHDLLAHLEWDIPGFVRWMEAQRVPKAMEMVNRTAVEFIKATLADADVTKALSQSEKAEALWIERKAASFTKAAQPEDKDEVTVGSFDRVHIVPGKRALILDYKTARADKSAEAIKKAYVEQMTAYRTSLHAMTGIPLEAIACKLIVVRAKPCVIDMA